MAVEANERMESSSEPATAGRPLAMTLQDLASLSGAEFDRMTDVCDFDEQHTSAAEETSPQIPAQSDEELERMIAENASLLGINVGTLDALKIPEYLKIESEDADVPDVDDMDIEFEEDPEGTARQMAALFGIDTAFLDAFKVPDHLRPGPQDRYA